MTMQIDNQSDKTLQRIDDETFYEMQELLDEDFQPLVEDYMRSAIERIAKLESACSSGDNATGFELAHSLKGASANLGLTQLTELSHRLQEACRDGSIDSHASLIEHIHQEILVTNELITSRF